MGVLPGAPRFIGALAQIEEAFRSRRKGCRCPATRTNLRSVELRLGRPIWNVNRTSEPGLGANECMPSGKWCKSTAFRHGV